MAANVHCRYIYNKSDIYKMFIYKIKTSFFFFFEIFRVGLKSNVKKNVELKKLFIFLKPISFSLNIVG